MKKLIITVVSISTAFILNGQITVSPQNNVTIGSTANSSNNKLYVENNDQENAVLARVISDGSSRYFRRGFYNYLQISTNDQYVYGTDNNVTVTNSGTKMGHGLYNLLWVDADIDAGYASRNIINSHSNAGNSKLYGVHSYVNGAISSSSQVYSGYFTGAKVFIGNDLIIGSSYNCTNCRINGTNSIAKPLSQLSKLLPQKVGYKNGKKEKNSFDFEFSTFQKEFPELGHKVVMEDDTEGFAFNYIGLIPVMVAAINERTEHVEELEDLVKAQNTQIQQLNDKINEIEELINLSSVFNSEVIKNDIRISPNPTRNSVLLEYQNSNIAKVDCIVFSNSGDKIFSKTLSDPEGIYNINIDCASWPTGNYIVTMISDEANLVSKKIVVQ